jgi:riboflavin-specific deaminase-like protein
MKKSGARSQKPAAVNRRQRATKNQALRSTNSPRPFVFINMSTTADGKIATANRAITSFGSKRDLAHLYELRATADAVMSGARTIEQSHAKLDPGGVRFQRQRVKNGFAEYNLRIIVTGSGTIDPCAEIFRHHFSPIIILTTERTGAKKLAALRQLADEVIVCGKSEINFPNALRDLRRRWKIKRLLCEGGAELNDSLIRAGVVDELHLTICPKILGGRTAPTIADGIGVEHLAQAAQFEFNSLRRVGDEMFAVLRAKR